MSNRKKLYMMVDLETLDTKPTACIVSIGAALFDKDGINKARFYVAVDKDSCLYKGMSINKNTVDWWDKQSEEAKAVFTDPNRVTINQALLALSNYVYKTVSTHKSIHMVGNSARFDMGILENAYHACGLKPFWNPFLERDYRSWKSMGKVNGVDVPKINRGDGTYHNALDDTIAQAEHAIELNKYYGGILL